MYDLKHTSRISSLRAISDFSHKYVSTAKAKILQRNFWWKIIFRLKKRFNFKDSATVLTFSKKKKDKKKKIQCHHKYFGRQLRYLHLKLLPE